MELSAPKSSKRAPAVARRAIAIELQAIRVIRNVFPLNVVEQRQCTLYARSLELITRPFERCGA